MNSRKRVECVLQHELPDRIPNCWGGCETAGLHVLAYERLVSALGLPKRAPRVDTFMFNAVMDEDVLLKMQGDMLLIASPMMCTRPLRSSDGWKQFLLFNTMIEMTDDHSLEEEKDMLYLLQNGKRYARCPRNSYYFDSIPNGGLFDDSAVPDPKDYYPRHDFSEKKLRELEKTAKRAYEETEFALCIGETLTDLQLMPGGMVAWYEAMINEPEIVETYLEKSVDAALDQLIELDQAVGKYCVMLSIAHDLGDSRGVTIGASLFRSCYKKHYKRLFHGWHERTNMKVNFHSCGSIVDILPDLIECGVDVYNPVQLSANRMDATTIKSIAGNNLVLYGGALDSITTPSFKKKEEVYDTVKKNVTILGRGGNYLFAGVHNTSADTPETHISATLQAFDDTKNMY